MAVPISTRWRLEDAGVHRPVTAGDVGGTKRHAGEPFWASFSPAPRANGGRDGGALGWVVQLLKRATSGGELDSKDASELRRAEHTVNWAR
jgi:hypothetical protein